MAPGKWVTEEVMARDRGTRGFCYRWKRSYCMGKEQVTEKRLLVSLFSLLAGLGFRSSEEGWSRPVSGM